MVRNRVKELRKERRLRQEELAGRINISQQTVSRIENGDNALAADILISQGLIPRSLLRKKLFCKVKR